MVAPHFHFTSPLADVLPRSMQSNTLIQAALYPGFSQVTSLLGVTEGRPKAPFEYTNTWGECLTLLLPWLLVAWWSHGSRKQRKWVLVTAAAALIPLVYSLNRTVWVAIGLTAVYLAVRLAARGRLALLGLVCAGLALVGVAVVATPLQGLITSRLQHQQSNSIRGSLSVTALQDANSAPVIGYGDTQAPAGKRAFDRGRANVELPTLRRVYGRQQRSALLAPDLQRVGRDSLFPQLLRVPGLAVPT